MSLRLFAQERRPSSLVVFTREEIAEVIHTDNTLEPNRVFLKGNKILKFVLHERLKSNIVMEKKKDCRLFTLKQFIFYVNFPV